MKKIDCRIITTERTPVFIGGDVLASVDGFIRSLHLGREGVFILVDRNTREHCLPALAENSAVMAGARILEIDGGEASKTLAVAERLWNELLEGGAGRNSLLVNLGGGTVTDLGGFVAAGFKRGISYINIPTTLMGQCDAAIGGKTAVNAGMIKNQVGFFYAARAVFLYPGFLETLPAGQFRSGLAEMIKCALVGDEKRWRRILRHPVSGLMNMPRGKGFLEDLLSGTVRYKTRIVARDYREHKLRKVLNFGHTMGHAMETYSLMNSREPLLHGEAVAAGMVCALYLSARKAGLDAGEAASAQGYLVDGFPPFRVTGDSAEQLPGIMAYDKKNFNGKFYFTLISGPGAPVINVPCTREEVLDTLDYYKTLTKDRN